MNLKIFRSPCGLSIVASIAITACSFAASGVEPVDCDEPNGTFPVVHPGHPEDCAGYSNVNTNPDGTVYWDVDSHFGSVCFNGLRNNYAAPVGMIPEGTPAPFTPDGVNCGWFVDANGGMAFNAPYGFRGPLSALTQPGLGDFLSPSPVLGQSSVSLVPSGKADSSIWWNDASRQTLNQSVDLVTGMPLIKVNQLELPFDGASFRLIRTRSGHREDQKRIGHYDSGGGDQAAAVDRWWNWSGQGWMANENPVLIIDSAVPDIVGNNPRMTWLVLDAHHSIPFQLIESNGVYAAPPRFRAKLSHNGVWDASVRDWATPPTQMEVFLYDGELKYTFVVVREDIPLHPWNKEAALDDNTDEVSSLHDRPFLPDQYPSDDPRYSDWDPFDTCNNPGVGLPYMGMCVKIEDQNQHTVEINYCGIEQQAVDFYDPGVELPGSEHKTDGNTCIECGQACTRKGLIRSVKLKTNGVTRWSLIYAYRGFRGSNSDIPNEFFDDDSLTDEQMTFRKQDLWGSYQIDRIYAFKVDDVHLDPEEAIINQYQAATGSLHDTFFLSVNQDDVLDLDGLGVDPLFELMGSNSSIADGWTHLVQNHFLKKDADGDGVDDGVWNGAVKIMTAVTSRTFEDENDPGLHTENLKRWAYLHEGVTIPNQDIETYPKLRYEALRPKAEDSHLSSDLNWIRRIYTPEDVSNVLTSTELGFTQPMTLYHLLNMLNPDDDGDLDKDGSAYEPSEVSRVAGMATYQFEYGLNFNGGWATEDGSKYSPNAQRMLEAGYLLNDNERTVTDEDNFTVGRAAVPDENGQKRYYQINRLFVSPTDLLYTGDAGGNDEAFVTDSAWIGEENNQRSAFVHPYQWHGYVPRGGWADSTTTQPPDLTQVRWVTIIDEFASEADLYPTSDDLGDGFGKYNGVNATKKSQISRRVVELSPSGYLLRDRKWEFSEDGVIRSGGGLGEQFIYKTIADYFGDLGEEPNAPSAGAGNTRSINELSNVRNEILSVEHRSIGWSAGEFNNDAQFGVENGYTRFTKYEAFHPGTETWGDYDSDSEKLIPMTSRVQAVAEGFHRGSNYIPTPGAVGWDIVSPHPNEALFTSQVIRDPEVPTDVIAQIDFISKTTEADLLDVLPAADWQNPDMSYQVQRTFIERDDSLDEDGEAVPEEEQPVTGRMVVGIPRQMYPGSSWYYPIEREFYDEEGNPTWACTGQLKDPSDPNNSSGTDPYESLTFTYFERDDEGRSLETVLDAVAGESIASSHPDRTNVLVGQWPTDKAGTQWQRVGTSEALNYVTSFVYDRYAPGLCDIFYPNGRRWARRVITLTDSNEFNAYMDEYSREFIYNNLELREDDAGVARWTTVSECIVKDYRDTNIYQPAMVTRKVTIVPGTLPNDATTLRVSAGNQPEWILNTAIQMGVDSNGRVQKASLLERTPSGALLAVGSKEVNDLGEIYREQEIDETITVQIRNSIGQTLRVYQGTEDRRWYLPPSAWSGIPSPNMILLERTNYGSGVNDAWMPTVMRQYDETPSWAESDLFVDEPEISDDNGLPIGDIDGKATIIGYDWQSRAVRTDTYGRGDPFSDVAENQPRRLSTSLVYLDYLDRPYLEVTYGEDPVGVDPGSQLLIPTNLDPTGYLDAELFPTSAGNELDVAQLYLGDGHLRPTSLTQSFYSVDGTLIERRSYDSGWDMAVTPSPTYLASYSYNGRGGNQIFSQSPGGSVEVTHLDSVGRMSSSVMMMPTTDEYSGSNLPVNLVERERTDMVYDADGNVVETKHWERVGAYSGAGDEVLNLSNAVRTRTLNWFDVQKRLVATASLGTENANGYVASPAVYDHAYPGPGDVFTDFTPPSWDESASKVIFDGVDLDQSALADALVRVYEYDEAGNKVLSIDPKGIATRYEYTPAGLLAYKTENAADPVWENKRMSGYRYQAGRLVEMNLVTLDGRGNDPVQAGDPSLFISTDIAPEDIDVETGLNFDYRTRLKYGAEIVSSNGNGGYWVSSKSNKLIGSMHLPNENTGAPEDDADVILRYTYSGQVAQRFNNAGEAFKYLYDDQGRLTDVIVGVWDPTQPPVFVEIDFTSIPPLMTPEPTDKIRYIHYAYDARGNLTDVQAWTEHDPDDRILITHTRMAYDARDRLINEWQLHGEGVIDDLKTPHTAYSWEYEATSLGLGGSAARTGHDRLTSMTYPVPDANVNPRVLTMKYGGLDGSDQDMLSQLTAIQSNIGTLHLAGFEYTASGRRVSLNLKNGKIWNSSNYNVDPNIPGLNGYDMFGRKSESRYTDNVSNILYRANYTFDKTGDRTSALIQQADVAGQSRYNIRSVVNVYDDLHRLIGAEVGEIDLAADPINNPQIKLNTTVHNDSWSLDLLGNWVGKIDDQTGDLLEHGRQTTGSLDSFGVPWSISTYDSYTSYDFGITQNVTQRSSISQLGIFEQTDGNIAVEKSIEPEYDEVGRTLFDGEYGYHFDAWGRVVQINEATADYDDTSGQQVGFTYGAMVKHFVYDGFGRLVRTSSPVDDPDVGESAEIIQSVSFFYDGARRVQEIINDPVSTIAGALNSGDSGLQGMAGQSTNLSNPDGSNAPLSLEKGQNPQPLTRNIYREYVWGPGDNGPDELLLQTDELDDEYWCLMDGGGDLVALVDVQGSDVDVVRQWTYDAYGAILTAEHLGTSLETHVGHKGLFVDRLDVTMTANSLESPRLVPYAHTLYQNRNRSYSPSLGRFLQMDPNQTAMALLSNTASHGRGIGAISIAFSMEGMYGDGLNLYQYLSSNPWTNSDPLGLSDAFQDEIDAIINEYIGVRSAILSGFGQEALAAAKMAAHIASYLPFPGVGLVGDLALVALGEISMEEALMGAAIGIVPGGKLIKLLAKSGAGRAIGQIGRAAWKQAKSMASQGGSFLARKGGGLAARAAGWVARKASKLVGAGKCGCFTATTLVMTANGAVPIVDIEAGHQVLSAVDDGLSQDYSSNAVGTKIVVGEAALVQLQLLHEDGKTETINTTDEHPFHVSDMNAWTRADQLLVGDELSTISGTAQLQSVVFTTERVPVYNLSIPGSPTYYVGEHGVWVHNCDYGELARQLKYKKKIPANKVPFNSHGQDAYQKGQKMITQDIDGHNGGVWKRFEKRGGNWVREGTYNADLTKRIGD